MSDLKIEHKRRRLFSSNKSFRADDTTMGDDNSSAALSISQQQQQQQQQQKQQDEFSWLLHCPHELLLMILDYVLVYSEALMLHSKARFGRTKRRAAAANKRSPLLNVLLACRRLYTAGVEVFYGRNKLRFQHAEHLRKFLSGLSSDQTQWIDGFELDVSWVRSRRTPPIWSPLHEINYPLAWKDDFFTVECLPRLRSIVIRNGTKFDGAEMRDGVRTEEFEQRMRDEMGERSGMLSFVWPKNNNE